MASIKTDRRHFLAIFASAVAACAGLAATGLPAIAAADPIFAAIDDHRAAGRAFDAAFRVAWLRNGYGGGPSVSVECAVEVAAIDRVIDTAPTTRAGLKALSDYLTEIRSGCISGMISQRLQAEGHIFEINPDTNLPITDRPFGASTAFFIARRAEEIELAA
jgi:hypothetical protein